MSILLFLLVVSGMSNYEKFDKWNDFIKNYLSSSLPEINMVVPLLTPDTLGTDSTLLIVDWQGGTGVDSFFIRWDTTGYPASKSGGISLASGALSDTSNLYKWDYDLAYSSRTVYIRAFVQDSLDNVRYRSAYKADNVPPDTFDTAPQIVHTPPLTFTIYLNPSEIDARDIDSLRFVLFDDYNLYLTCDGQEDWTKSRKSFSVAWNEVVSDSSIAFKKPVFFNFDVESNYIVAWWGKADTTAITYLICSLKDKRGNENVLDTVSCGDTIYSEIPPRPTSSGTNERIFKYYSIWQVWFAWDTTGVFPFRNEWMFDLLDSNQFIIYTGHEDVNYEWRYSVCAFPPYMDAPWAQLDYVSWVYAGQTLKTEGNQFPNLKDFRVTVDEVGFPYNYREWDTGPLENQGDSIRLGTHWVVLTDSISFSSDVRLSEWYWMTDTTTAPADSVPITIVNVGQPIPQEVAITYYPRKVYFSSPKYNPFGQVWVYLSYTGYHGSDSTVLAVEEFDDLLTDSIRTYSHAPAEDIWCWAYLYTPAGTRGTVASYDSVVNQPADLTPPSISGGFTTTAAPLNNIVLSEVYPVVSYDDDFSHFRVWFKANRNDTYTPIDTLHIFDSVEDIRLPSNVFLYDSAFIVVTAIDTNNNESTVANSLKDTLGFTPANIYITFLSGDRGQPSAYWFYRNELDSVANDSIRIPASFIDTTLTDTCKVPVIPADTLVQAYYALRTIANDTLGIMSAWLKWPEDEGLPDDETPPDIAGSINVVYDSTYHVKFISTSAYSSSPDFNHFNIYFKSSAGASYTKIDSATTLSAGDRFHIIRTLSYNDSGWVKVTAVDDSANESTSYLEDSWTTSPYFVLFETLGGLRKDIDNVWIYLSPDSSAIDDSFRISIDDIDTTSYEPDTLDVPVNPPNDGYGRYYAGRSDSSGVLKARSNWKWYPAPPVPDTMVISAVASDTVNVQVEGFPSHSSNRGTYNIRYKSDSYPTSKTDGTSLYSGTDTSAINNDNFPVSGVGGTTQYFRLFAWKNGVDAETYLSDTTTFPSGGGGGCETPAVLEYWTDGNTSTSFNDPTDTLFQSFQNGAAFTMDGDSLDIRYAYNGGPGDSIVVFLCEDNAGVPNRSSSAILARVAKIYSAMPTSQDMAYYQFSTQLNLSASTTYWIGITTVGTFNWAFYRDGDGGYANGKIMYVDSGGALEDGSPWDMNFKIMGCE